MSEISEEEKEANSTSRRRVKVNWRKVGLWVLFVLSTVLVFCLGYFGVSFWDNYFNRSSYTADKSSVEDWQVYRNEDFDFGFRYPADWETEAIKKKFIIFKPTTAEGEESVREYISLKISSTGSRAQTSCEKDQTNCSFYANDIFGDKTVTPNEESVFFSNSKNDFTLTLHKYGDADLADTFEGIWQSLRFISSSDTEEDNAEAT